MLILSLFIISRPVKLKTSLVHSNNTGKYLVLLLGTFTIKSGFYFNVKEYYIFLKYFQMAHCAKRKDCRVFAGSEIFVSVEKLMIV